MSQCDVLITGGGGFIGSHLVEQMVQAGRRVRVLELTGACVDHLPTDSIEIVFGDIRHRDDVAAAVAGADQVIHLAANPNLWARRAADFDEINHRGAANVIELAAEAGAKRIVHVSTESILAQRDRTATINEKARSQLEDMPGSYCRSKWLAEAAARAAVGRGGPVVIVSPVVPVGIGDHRGTPMTRLFIDFAAGRIKARVDADISLIDVRDAAAGIGAALDHGQIGQRYLLAGETWSTRDLFDALAKLTGWPAPKHAVPHWLALGFAYVEQWYCGLTGRTPMASVEGVKLSGRGMRFDASASWTTLGLTPRPVVEAIADAVRWLADQGRLKLAPKRLATSYPR